MLSVRKDQGKFQAKVRKQGRNERRNSEPLLRENIDAGLRRYCVSNPGGRRGPVERVRGGEYSSGITLARK